MNTAAINPQAIPVLLVLALIAFWILTAVSERVILWVRQVWRKH